MAGAIHAGDGVKGDGLHVPGEAREAHDLARRFGVHADDAAVAQVQDVAAVLLQKPSAESRQQLTPAFRTLAWHFEHQNIRTMTAPALYAEASVGWSTRLSECKTSSIQRAQATRHSWC